MYGFLRTHKSKIYNFLSKTLNLLYLCRSKIMNINLNFNGYAKVNFIFRIGGFCRF